MVRHGGLKGRSLKTLFHRDSCGQIGTKRVLVHLLGSLGDCLVAIPALRAIRRHFGDPARITVLHEIRRGIRVSPRDVVAENVKIDQFLGYPVSRQRAGRLLQACFLWARLWALRFSDVVSLMPSERLSSQIRRDKKFFSLAGMRDQYGFQEFPMDLLYPRDSKGKIGRTHHEAWFYLRRLELSGIDISKESNLEKPFFVPSAAAQRQAQKWLASRGWKPGQRLVAIGPGAKKQVSLWPTDRFEELARRVLRLGQHQIVLVGGEAEHGICESIIGKLGAGLNSAGLFDVAGSAAILENCDLLLGLDTGSTHLAAVMGVPCVALYSGVDHPGRWEPLGEGHHVLRKEVSCSPCQILWGPCPVLGHPCMTSISVNEVWEKAELILRLPPRGWPHHHK